MVLPRLRAQIYEYNRPHVGVEAPEYKQLLNNTQALALISGCELLAPTTKEAEVQWIDSVKSMLVNPAPQLCVPMSILKVHVALAFYVLPQ